MKKLTLMVAIAGLFLTGCVSTKPQIRLEKLDITEEKKARALVFFKEGVVLLGELNYDQAIAKFSQATAEDSGLYPAFYNRAIAYESLGKLKEAEQSYEACLAINKKQPACLQNIVIAKVKQGEREEAKDLVQAYLTEFPEEPFVHVAGAQLAFLENDIKAAEQHARLAIEREAENIEALFIMAKIFFAKKEYASAKWVIKNALEIAPSHGGLYLLLGHTYMELDRQPNNTVGSYVNDALDSYALAVKFQATEEALESYGLLLLKRGRIPESIRNFQQLTTLFPLQHRHFIHLGNALKADKQFEESRGAYIKAMELDSSDKDINFNLGVLYLDIKPEGLSELDRLRTSQSYFKAFREIPELSNEQKKEVDDYLKTLEQKIEVEEYVLQSAAEQAKEVAEEGAVDASSEDSTNSIKNDDQADPKPEEDLKIEEHKDKPATEEKANDLEKSLGKEVF